jgi:hypothetical protein
VTHSKIVDPLYIIHFTFYKKICNFRAFKKNVFDDFLLYILLHFYFMFPFSATKQNKTKQNKTNLKNCLNLSNRTSSSAE